MKKATLPVAILLLIIILGMCLSLSGMQKDLKREQWCRENGYRDGILKARGRVYCMDSPVPILLPEYLQ